MKTIKEKKGNEKKEREPNENENKKEKTWKMGGERAPNRNQKGTNRIGIQTKTNVFYKESLVDPLWNAMILQILS